MKETCSTPVGDLHAEPMAVPFASGFFPTESAAIKIPWDLTVKTPPNHNPRCHLLSWGSLRPVCPMLCHDMGHFQRPCSTLEGHLH